MFYPKKCFMKLQKVPWNKFMAGYMIKLGKTFEFHETKFHRVVLALTARFRLIGGRPYRCCHISPDSANGRRTDRKNAKKKKMFIRWRKSSRCDDGRRGRCKERIKRMSNA